MTLNREQIISQTNVLENNKKMETELWRRSDWNSVPAGLVRIEIELEFILIKMNAWINDYRTGQICIQK